MSNGMAGTFTRLAQNTVEHTHDFRKNNKAENAAFNATKQA